MTATDNTPVLSTTNSLVTRITVFRNPSLNSSPNYLNVAVSQLAYVAIVPFALIETIISHLAYVLARILPIDAYWSTSNWSSSCRVSSLWLLYNLFTNLFVKEAYSSENLFAQNVLGAQNPTTPARPTPAVSSSTRASTIEAQLLAPYDLGECALQFSEVLRQIYANIPQPTANEKSAIAGEVASLFPNYQSASIKSQLESITSSTNEWSTRFTHMLVAIRKEIVRRNDPSEIEIFKGAVSEGFGNCSNRKSTEIERLYFAYAAPHLNASYLQSLTPVEGIKIELGQLRAGKRDEIINSICNDSHNAASHNYFRRKLNESVFLLPPSPLSQHDLQYSSFAMSDKENEIRQAFRLAYSPQTIYAHFNAMLYPKQGEVFRFKPAMFISWLQAKGRMNADAYTDDALTTFKPQLVIEYLEELKFLRKR